MQKHKGKSYNGKVEFKKVSKCLVCNNINFEKLFETIDIRIKKKIITVICNNCGFIFQDPMPTEKSYIDFYKVQRNSNFEKSIEDIIKPKKNLHKLFVKILQDNLKGMSKMDALDYGSGDGSFLYYLKPIVNNLKSLEISEKAKKTIKNKFSVDLLFGSSLRNVGIKKKSLDLITGLAIIEHLKNPFIALKQFNDYLKENGYLFLYTHDIKKPFFQGGKKSYFKFIHPYYFSVNSLSNILQQTGFGNIKYLSFDCEKNYKENGIIDVTSGFFVILAQKKKNNSSKIFKDNKIRLKFIFLVATLNYYFYLMQMIFLRLYQGLKKIFKIKNTLKYDKYHKTLNRYIKHKVRLTKI